MTQSNDGGKDRGQDVISKTCTFSVEKRRNVFRTSGTEYALYVSFTGNPSWWLIKAWGKKPTLASIKDAKEVAMRSFEVYHKQIRIPPFQLTEE